MTSSTPGASTSPVEIGNIDGHGLWLLVEGKEYFLPYEDFPWFRNATVAQIVKVEIILGFLELGPFRLDRQGHQLVKFELKLCWSHYLISYSIGVNDTGILAIKS